jgi:hypothetical protein
MQASKVLTASAGNVATLGGTVNLSGTWQVGGVAVTATAAELNYLDIAVLGTGAWNKAVVLDGNGDFIWPATTSGIDLVTNSAVLKLGSSDWEISGTAVTATGAELNYLDIAALGTGAASKAVVLDGSGNYTAPAGTWNLSGATAVNTPTGGLQIGGVAITSTAAELNVLDGVSATLAATDLNITELTTLGTHEASKALTLSAGGHMTGIAGDWGLTSVTSIDIAVGALELAGVAVGATAAELNVLDGATAGTQVANKAVVADANINTGVSKVTQLHIGASGSEVQVTATPAELNLNDGQVASVTFTPSGGVGSGTVTTDFKDAAGVQMAIPTGFTFWFSSVATGLDHLAITTSVAANKGSVDARGAVAGSDIFHGITDAAGEFDVTVTAAADDYYMVVQLPNGKLQISAVLTLT